MQLPQAFQQTGPFSHSYEQKAAEWWKEKETQGLMRTRIRYCTERMLGILSEHTQ